MAATVLDSNHKTNTTLSGSPIGANLLPASAPNTGAGVAWNAGTGTATATAAADIVRWLNFLKIGKFYQVTLNYTMSSGSKLRIANGATNGVSIAVVSAVLSASGSLTLNFQALDVNMSIEADTAVFSGTVSSISIKEVPPLVATSTGAGGVYSSKMISGPCYFEATPTTITGAPSVGITLATWNTSTALTAQTGSIGYLATGAVQINGVTVATIATWAAGNRIDCAVDPDARLIWFRVAGGNWNNNAANNPATGVGGIDISSLIFGSMAAAVYASLTGNVWTTVFSAASFAGVPPAGFSSIDVSGYATADSTKYTPAPGAAPAVGTLASEKPTDGSTQGRHFSPAGPVTVVSGTTKESGTVVTGRLVEVFDRNTGDRLGYTVSDGGGNWSIPCLGRPSVRVVGSDPTTFNSQVFDNAVPV